MVSLLSLAGCLQSNEERLAGSNEYPSEWMYLQRAGTDGLIDPVAVEQAISQTEIAVQRRRSEENAWQLAGPVNTGGRVTDIQLDPENQDIIYVGTSNGGVFKSTDQGTSWLPVFEEVGRMSIGNLAVAPSAPQTIYVGTGEANGSATSGAFFGDGIYKSHNGGTTWQHVGLENSQHVGRIVVDPQDPDRVFVAAAGLLYGKSLERGVYRTLDGGLNWERVLFVSDSTACIDIVMNPQDPDILFAAMWERRRYPHHRVYGGVTSGIHRSVDGGDSWALLAGGLPEPDTETGRIGLAMSPSTPSVIYASYTTNPVTNNFNGVYRSLNGGDDWLRVDDGSLAAVFASFGWFFGNMRVHPEQPDSVYILGLTSYVSGNAGMSWFPHSKGNVHVDHHALEIHPLDPDFQVAGNDGGVYITHNGGDNWEHVRTLPITQFYTSEVDVQIPDRVYGGTQDNGTVRTPSGADNDWERILGGDGFYVIVDPVSNNNVYAEWQWGNLSKSIDGGNVFMGAVNGIDPADRTNWNTPVVMNPVNPVSLYYGSHRLYKTTNRADFWLPVSEDLTNPDPDYLGGEFSGTISTIAVAPSDTNAIYIGTDDGMVQVSFNDGADWQVISDDLLLTYVTRVAVDPYDALSVFVTLSGYREVDYLPHVFHSPDGGQTWINISGDLPEVPVNDIIIDPDLELTYYVATDLGVWYTVDGGFSWDILGTELPMTVCNDLTLHRDTRKLVVATFGRSMYTYDLSEPTSVRTKARPDPEFAVYPNPVANQSEIRLNLPRSLATRADLMSIDGKLVRNLISETLPAGPQRITWHRQEEPSGMYVIRIMAGEALSSRTVILE